MKVTLVQLESSLVFLFVQHNQMSSVGPTNSRTVRFLLSKIEAVFWQSYKPLTFNHNNDNCHFDIYQVTGKKNVKTLHFQ